MTFLVRKQIALPNSASKIRDEVLYMCVCAVLQSHHQNTDLTSINPIWALCPWISGRKPYRQVTLPLTLFPVNLVLGLTWDKKLYNSSRHQWILGTLFGQSTHRTERVIVL